MRLPLLIAVAVASPLHAATTFLPPAKDNTLYESSTGDLSNGAGPHLFAGLTRFFGARRAVLAFDLAPLPPAIRVTDASLTLTVSNSGPSGAVAGTLHRLESDWGEGASVAGGAGGSGAAASPGDATWLHTFHPGSFWTAPGGDFAGNPSATATLPAAGTVTFAALADDVRAWLLDPSANHGWLLGGDESAAAEGTAKRFHSREASAEADRPRLSVTYDLLGDADRDGDVDDADLAAITLGPAGAWTTGDFNADGRVDADDLSLYDFGRAVHGTGGSAAVPEPALTLLPLALLLRRRVSAIG